MPTDPTPDPAESVLSKASPKTGEGWYPIGKVRPAEDCRHTHDTRHFLPRRLV